MNELLDSDSDTGTDTGKEDQTAAADNSILEVAEDAEEDEDDEDDLYSSLLTKSNTAVPPPATVSDEPTSADTSSLPSSATAPVSKLRSSSDCLSVASNDSLSIDVSMTEDAVYLNGSDDDLDVSVNESSEDTVELVSKALPIFNVTDDASIDAISESMVSPSAVQTGGSFSDDVEAEPKGNESALHTKAAAVTDLVMQRLLRSVASEAQGQLANIGQGTPTAAATATDAGTPIDTVTLSDTSNSIRLTDSPTRTDSGSDSDSDSDSVDAEQPSPSPTKPSGGTTDGDIDVDIGIDEYDDDMEFTVEPDTSPDLSLTASKHHRSSGGAEDEAILASAPLPKSSLTSLSAMPSLFGTPKPTPSTMTADEDVS